MSCLLARGFFPECFRMSGNHTYFFSVLFNISPCQRVSKSQVG